MAATAHHVIIGASAAGVAAALALREHGFDGRVTLLEAGAEPPYERPPLSKELAAGEDSLIRPIVPIEEYRARAIDLRLGTPVRSVDPGEHTVRLADGSLLPADRILLATGVSARRLEVPGSDLGNVLTLRTADDARRLAAALRTGGPVVVIGGGFIGLEVAAAARAAGCEVTVVEVAELPLLPVLGRRLAELMTSLHRDEGVHWRLGAAVEALHGSQSVGEVRLSTAERLPAAVVVVGVGVVPNDELARAAGVRCDGGIVVDLHGRTSDPWIMAAGDVTVQPHPYLARAGRIEHWDNALQQGTVAGATMAGVLRSHDAVPYFWSDQYGLTLQMVGRPRADDELLLRPGAGPRRFVALWQRDGVVVAGAGLDAGRDLAAVRRLVDRRSRVAAERLLAPDADLRQLARS